MEKYISSRAEQSRAQSDSVVERERERESRGDGQLIRASELEGEAGGHQEAWRSQGVHLHPQ